MNKLIQLIAICALTIGSLGCDSMEGPGQSDSLCQEAATYFTACTETADFFIGDSCDQAQAMEVLEMPCEVLRDTYVMDENTKADGGFDGVLSFTCRWFGVGCPADKSCLPTLNDFELQTLIELSEPTSLSGPEDAQGRINTIAAIFRNAGDPRGLFATVYRLITNRAVESVDAGDYEYPVWARNLITEFARRYLTNLHYHLIGGPVSGQWAKYYGIAQDCNVGRGRTVGVAIAVHLMVDLPYTLYKIGSMPEQREDFILFGDILLEVFPQLIIDVKADYDEDVTDLLNGFFVGKWVDSMKGLGTTTEFIYQGIRMKAWRDGQNLRKFPEAVVNADILTAWGIVEVSLAKLDASGVL